MVGLQYTSLAAMRQLKWRDLLCVAPTVPPFALRHQLLRVRIWYLDSSYSVGDDTSKRFKEDVWYNNNPLRDLYKDVHSL